VFAEKRLGGRAKHANDLIRQAGPAMTESFLAMVKGMSPDARAKVESTMASMGSSIENFEDMLRRSKS
jgi:hypothetical protein